MVQRNRNRYAEEAITENQLMFCHKNHEEEQDYPQNQYIRTKMPLNYVCQKEGQDCSL